MSSAYSITLWMQADVAMKPLKCMSVQYAFNGFEETKIPNDDNIIKQFIGSWLACLSSYQVMVAFWKLLNMTPTHKST